MKAPIFLSVIIPAFNEEHLIADTLTKLRAYLDKHAELAAHEVIVSAAGTDRTAEIARTFSSKFNSLKVVTPAKRVGKGRDVRAGFAEATGEYQLFMDADLATPLHHIMPMVKQLQRGADVVIGRRKLSQIHNGKFRTFMSLASNWVTRLFIWPRIADTQCGFKGFTGEAARLLFAEQEVQGWGFDMEILVRAREAGLKVDQLPINDWKENRGEDLRGDNLWHAAVGTLLEVLRIRASAWMRFLARHFYMVVGLSVLAIFAAAVLIGRSQSAWFDEAYSVTLTQQSVHKLWHLTSVDVHPPLYYLTLKGWAAIFGWNDVGWRSFSAVCAALAGGTGLLLAKRLFGRKAALMAVPFVMLAPYLLRYGFEIRMYAFASLICALGTYVLVAAMEAVGRKRALLWGLYALIVAAGMYTLYFTALIWMAHLAWCLYELRKTHRSLAPRLILRQPWFWAFVSATLLLAPWLPTFFAQAKATQSYSWHGAPTWADIVSMITFVTSYLPSWQVGTWQTLVTFGGFGFAVYFVVKAFKLANPNQKRYMTLFALIALAPPVLMYLLSLPPLKSLYIERYISHAVLAGYMLLGVSAYIVTSAGHSVWRKLVVLGLIAVFFQGAFNVAQAGNFNYTRNRKTEGRPLVAYLQSQHAERDIIVADEPQLWFETHIYWTTAPIYFYNIDGRITDSGGYAILADSPMQIYKASDIHAPRVWYIRGGDPMRAPVPAGYKQASTASFGTYKADLYVKE